MTNQNKTIIFTAYCLKRTLSSTATHHRTNRSTIYPTLIKEFCQMFIRRSSFPTTLVTFLPLPILVYLSLWVSIFLKIFNTKKKHLPNFVFPSFPLRFIIDIPGQVSKKKKERISSRARGQTDDKYK